MEDFNRGDDDKVEEHIKALTEKAKQLINRQMGQVQEEGGKRGKKQGAGGISGAASVTAAGSTNIYAGATSQKSATNRRGTIA